MPPRGGGGTGLPPESDTFGFGPRLVRPRDSEEPEPPLGAPGSSSAEGGSDRAAEGLLGAGGACPLGTGHKAVAPISTPSLAVGATVGEGTTFRLPQTPKQHRQPQRRKCRVLCDHARFKRRGSLSGAAPSSPGPGPWANTGGTWPGLGEPQWSGQHGAWAWAQGAGGAGGGSQGRAGMTARSDLPGGTHRPLQGPEARDRAAAERHPRARLAHSLAGGLGHGQQLLGASVSPSAKWG